MDGWNRGRKLPNFEGAVPELGSGLNLPHPVTQIDLKVACEGWNAHGVQATKCNATPTGMGQCWLQLATGEDWPQNLSWKRLDAEISTFFKKIYRVASRLRNI